MSSIALQDTSNDVGYPHSISTQEILHALRKRSIRAMEWTHIKLTRTITCSVSKLLNLSSPHHHPAPWRRFQPQLLEDHIPIHGIQIRV